MLDKVTIHETWSYACVDCYNTDCCHICELSWQKAFCVFKAGPPATLPATQRIVACSERCTIKKTAALLYLCGMSSSCNGLIAKGPFLVSSAFNYFITASLCKSHTTRSPRSTSLGRMGNCNLAWILVSPALTCYTRELAASNMFSMIASIPVGSCTKSRSLWTDPSSLAAPTYSGLNPWLNPRLVSQERLKL